MIRHRRFVFLRVEYENSQLLRTISPWQGSPWAAAAAVQKDGGGLRRYDIDSGVRYADRTAACVRAANRAVFSITRCLIVISRYLPCLRTSEGTIDDIYFEVLVL